MQGQSVTGLHLQTRLVCSRNMRIKHTNQRKLIKHTITILYCSNTLRQLTLALTLFTETLANKECEHIFVISAKLYFT